MRSRIMMLALASFLSSTAAFAGETTAVTIPFSFESQGEHFPASQYEVKLSKGQDLVTITSKQAPARTLFLLVHAADINRHDPGVTIRFEDVGGLHELRSIRVGHFEYSH
jgi:hypothetical protein